jgi:hypothetical protein
MQAIAKDLGVRYVLEGSVRKVGNRVRITAQLIDGGTGGHLWAEKYDRELEDIFAVQDEITLTVVGAIEPALGRAEQDRARRKPPDSLDAWDYFQQAMQYVWRPGKADTEEATRLLNLALEHDPNFCAAYACLTFQQFKNNAYGYANTETNKREILAAGKAALAADDQDALAFTPWAMRFWLTVTILTQSTLTTGPSKSTPVLPLPIMNKRMPLRSAASTARRSIAK